MKITANCRTCGQHLVTNVEYWHGRPYCHIHYQHEAEKSVNRRIRQETERLERLTEPYSNLVADIDEWSEIEATVSGSTITT